jgi:hypothetical protein
LLANVVVDNARFPKDAASLSAACMWVAPFALQAIKKVSPKVLGEDAALPAIDLFVSFALLALHKRRN